MLLAPTTVTVSVAYSSVKEMAGIDACGVTQGGCSVDVILQVARLDLRNLYDGESCHSN